MSARLLLLAFVAAAVSGMVATVAQMVTALLAGGMPA